MRALKCLFGYLKVTVNLDVSYWGEFIETKIRLEKIKRGTSR